MQQRAAAAFARRRRDRDAGAAQETRRRGVDLGGQDGLGAAGQQRDAATRARRRRRPASRGARPSQRGRRFAASASIAASCGPTRGRAAINGANGRASAASRKPSANSVARRQQPGERGAHQPVGQRPSVARLDQHARMVDQAAIIDARRAGGHAGVARQAMVDRPDVVVGRRPAALQQILDQIDAPARRVALVAGDDIGRTGRGAEAAMDAGAQDLLQRLGLRIGELLGGEVGLHRGYRDARRFRCRWPRPRGGDGRLRDLSPASRAFTSPRTCGRG